MAILRNICKNKSFETNKPENFRISSAKANLSCLISAGGPGEIALSTALPSVDDIRNINSERN